ncbi:MAG: hypothetical protein JWN70_4068 [Planctomycetaceae bacterium]|nr:hypothetical protein [Planctomycetaceae bacterium]
MLLADNYLDVRVAVASIFGRLKPIAKVTIPLLSELVNVDAVQLRDTLAAINLK